MKVCGRLRLLVALLLLALLSSATVLSTYPASAHDARVSHGCAPPIPPSVPGPLVPAPTTPGIVVINEVLSVPGSTWNCSENGTFSQSSDSWVELYNPQNQPYDLYAVHASFDNGPNTYVFYFPLGSAIAAHGYLVLFPSVYAGVLLARATLRFNITGVTIDQLTVPALATDQSFARTPDGSNNWQITSIPTIDASNTSLQVTPTPTSTSSASGSGGGSGSGVNNGSGSKTGAIVNGTQPAWSKLQLPTAVATPDSNVNAPQTVSQSSPALNNGSDLPRRILLTLLVIALALMLFWCWKLFMPR